MCDYLLRAVSFDVYLLWRKYRLYIFLLGKTQRDIMLQEGNEDPALKPVFSIFLFF